METAVTAIEGAAVVQAEVPAQTVVIDPSKQKARPVQTQQSQDEDPSAPATTTFQQDLTTAGQRKVNLIWEYTQACIAILVVITTMVCGGIGMYNSTQIPTIISVAFGMITGFYFSRTNHAAIGGVGQKPSENYIGR